METNDIKYEQFIRRIRSIELKPGQPEMLTDKIIRKIGSLPPRRANSKKTLVIKYIMETAAIILVGFFAFETLVADRNETTGNFISNHNISKNNIPLHYYSEEDSLLNIEKLTLPDLSHSEKRDLISSALKRKKESRIKQERMYTALINSINKANLR